MVPLTLILTLFPLVVLAQTPINGQIFTNGLSIINAPALNSEHNAGGNIPISIEVSGNGKLPFSALNPGSGLETAYEELNIFLVSSQTNTNLTVSFGPGLLTDETGTVRHLNYQIPVCIQPGQYNMTFYETSTLEKRSLYVITAIPISIQNRTPTANRCIENINDLQPQPQPDTPAVQSPFLPGAVTSSRPTLMTVTMTAAGKQIPTASMSDPSAVTTATMVIESPVITTEAGKTTPVTSLATFTTVVAMKSQDLSGFIPVTSSAKHLYGRSLFAHIIVVVARALICV